MNAVEIEEAVSALAGISTIKHIALNLLRRSRDRLSMRARRKAAEWDDDYLAEIVAAP